VKGRRATAARRRLTGATQIVLGVLSWTGRATKPVRRASRSSVLLASSDEVADVTGGYFESHGRPSRPSALALDVENQERARALGTSLCAQAASEGGVG
jgi:hypothetical protein